jgi:hypothetical protein
VLVLRLAKKSPGALNPRSTKTDRRFWSRWAEAFRNRSPALTGRYWKAHSRADNFGDDPTGHERARRAGDALKLSPSGPLKR